MGGEQRWGDGVGGCGSRQAGAVLLQGGQGSADLLKVLRPALLLRLLLPQRDGGELVRCWSPPRWQAARPSPQPLVDVAPGVQGAVIPLFGGGRDRLQQAGPGFKEVSSWFKIILADLEVRAGAGALAVLTGDDDEAGGGGGGGGGGEVLGAPS